MQSKTHTKCAQLSLKDGNNSGPNFTVEKRNRGWVRKRFSGRLARASEARLLRHHHASVCNSAVQNHCGKVRASTALRLDPPRSGRHRPIQQKAHKAQKMEINSHDSDLTIVSRALRAKRNEFNETPELIPCRRAGRDSANFASFRGQFHAATFSNQGAAIGDEELKQRQERERANQGGNHRVGATTLAVAIRASAGTLMNV